MSFIPVITIDGPSGSGKGTLCRLLAKRLGWHILDSGAIYRLLSLAAQKHQIAATNVDKLVQLAAELNIDFRADNKKNESHVFLDNEDVSLDLRTETCGKFASQISALPAVRHALLQKQRDFQVAPGLVCDGRDMGTVVFPAADLKIFLIASAEERAKRRYKQLKNKGLCVTLRAILEDMVARDERDSNRNAAPLKPAADSVQLDSSRLTVNAVLKQVLALAKERGLLQNIP